MIKKPYVFFLILVLIAGSLYLKVLVTEEVKNNNPFLGKETITPPKGLPPIPWPKDNPYSPEKAELGRLLYFDKRLSSDGTVSCATCHDPRTGYTNHSDVSFGIHGHAGTRNSPTIINAAYGEYMFWDGRAHSLEEQCIGPITNPKEMTSKHDSEAAKADCHARICAIAGYRTLFKQVFGNDQCSLDEIAKAIATFERTILSGNSPYDRYMAGDKTAMTPEQIRGFQVFKDANCMFCHLWPTFSENMFTNIGVGMDKENPDLGRYNITKNPEDYGAFKVPTLRDVALSYPYMHDGSQQTLEEVVEYYNKGGIPNRNLHPQMTPLNLSESDKKALVAFLHALSGEKLEHFVEPAAFPQ